VRVQISPGAAEFVAANGGQLWVWAARPRLCCSGSPAWMRAALTAPDGVTGFVTVDPADAGGVRIRYRPTAGQRPDVLEIGLTGGRRPRVAAYWDGCLMAMV
jgi:hypothetical protein